MLVDSFTRMAAPGRPVAHGWADVAPAALQPAALQPAALQPAPLQPAAPRCTRDVPQQHGPATPVESPSPGLLLEPDPAAAGRGRRWVCERAESLGASDDTLGVVELLTSELVTNAVKHGPADGVVEVDTRCVDGSLLVTVTDDGGQVPVVRDPELDEISGRGLMLVQRLAHDWGFTARPGHGTAVWFEIRLAVA